MATQAEIQPFLNLCDFNSDSKNSNFNLRYKNKNVNVTITGVGMVNTAFSLGLIAGSNHKFLFNVGICGSFDKNISIGSVVNVEEDCFSDLGVEDGKNFISLDELGLIDSVKIKNEKLIKSNSLIDQLQIVRGITVNTVHGNTESIHNVIQKFNPQVETMEGAAFFKFSNFEKCSAIQLRAVSNYVEKRNTQNWNIPLAIKNLNKKLIEILDSI